MVFNREKHVAILYMYFSMDNMWRCFILFFGFILFTCTCKCIFFTFPFKFIIKNNNFLIRFRLGT